MQQAAASTVASLDSIQFHPIVNSAIDPFKATDDCIAKQG
jgi:hypothetical protein